MSRVSRCYEPVEIQQRACGIGSLSCVPFAYLKTKNQVRSFKRGRFVDLKDLHSSIRTTRNQGTPTPFHVTLYGG